MVDVVVVLLLVSTQDLSRDQILDLSAVQSSIVKFSNLTNYLIKHFRKTGNEFDTRAKEREKLKEKIVEA